METNDKFIPRPYQEYLFKKALKENTILYLPTGAGKTFVATLLINALKDSLRRPLGLGGKRTIFAVNTVALVEQQKSFIRRHTNLTCEGYSSEDSHTDIWSDRKWKEEIRKNQVLVITAQIFLELLMHNVISLSDVNLLIFDECHRAVGNQPMRQIMQMFKNFSVSEQPRVLAMSASLLNCNVKAEKIYDTIRELEITFQAKIQTVYCLSEVSDFCTNPKEVIKYYTTPANCPILEKIQKLVDYAVYILNNVDLPDSTNLASSLVFQPDTKTDKLRRILLDVMDSIRSMGFFGGDFAISNRIEQILEIIANSQSKEVIYLLQMMNTQFLKIQNLMIKEMQVDCQTMKDRIYKYSTSKILTLFKTLWEFYRHITEAKEKFCCIIFVQRRYTAKALSNILNILSKVDENYGFLKTDFIVGTTTDSFKRSREILPQPKWNKQVIERFKKGEINCIVATDVVDEGLDVPSCTLVVRYFAPMDFRAYIQSKGRARHKFSQFIILAEDNNDYIDRYKNFVAAEKSLREILLGKERSKPSDDEITKTLYSTILKPYIVTDSMGGQSVVTANSAINLVNVYCMSLKNSSVSPVWILIVANECYQVNLTLPPASPLKVTIAGDFMESIEDAKKAAALKACIMLHKMGELNDKLIPIGMVMY